MENKNEKDNLSFSGFPMNDEIDLPDIDKASSSNQRSQLDALKNSSAMFGAFKDFKTFKQMIPQQLLDNLMGPNHTEEELEEAFNIAMGILSGDTDEDDLEGLLDDLLVEGETDMTDEDDDNLLRFNLASITHLTEQPFGDILVKPLQDGDIQYLMDNYKKLPIGVFNMTMSTLNEIVDTTSIESLELVFEEPNFALFKTNLKNANDLPFYIIGIRHYVVDQQDSSNELSLYVPTFMNTLNLSNDGNSIRVFNKETDSDFFDAKGEFFPFIMLGLLMGIKSMLVPYKKVLMSPALFGTFKPVKESIRNDSEWLRIGTLISNESAEAILLKKDADLDLNETKFPFYIKFDSQHTKESLQYLQDLLFKVDFGGTALMYFSELKFKNGRLYIDLDIGDF